MIYILLAVFLAVAMLALVMGLAARALKGASK